MQLQSLLLQTLGLCIMSNFMLNSSNSKIVTMEATDYLSVQKAPLLIQWKPKVKTFLKDCLGYIITHLKRQYEKYI